MGDRSDLFPSLDRFNAFSDGVFAIAITLLVLELPVPPEGTAVWPALRDDWHEFLAYFVSFAFIGGIWLTHARVSRAMSRGDSISYGVNLMVLMLVGLLPFSTSLMVTHLGSDDVRVGVIWYGANLLLASLALSVLMVYLAAEPALLTGARCRRRAEEAVPATVVHHGRNHRRHCDRARGAARLRSALRGHHRLAAASPARRAPSRPGREAG